MNVWLGLHISYLLPGRKTCMYLISLLKNVDRRIFSKNYNASRTCLTSNAYISVLRDWMQLVCRGGCEDSLLEIRSHSGTRVCNRCAACVQHVENACATSYPTRFMRVTRSFTIPLKLSWYIWPIVLNCATLPYVKLEHCYLTDIGNLITDWRYLGCTHAHWLTFTHARQ